MISYDYPNPSNDFYLNDLMEYDPSDNSWEVKSPYPGMPRSGTAVFTIGSYAYAGGGSNGAHLQDFYRYNPSTNTWIEIEELSGPVQVRGAFPINSKGYVVLENNFNGTHAKIYAEILPANVIRPQSNGITVYINTLNNLFSFEGFVQKKPG